ncbi:hypothetical protein Xvie_01408 [Xenorhabdus vietnamensis]|uniref:Uncharacterized protein n=1 Tax=Xenorhabdus vietnamensis TaxID=351656 RepID=A0A1Y2SHV6_9GAMM|nr:hypothetical protein Xvie_01408 [Xenorhabdus vietnamensis]
MPPFFVSIIFCISLWTASEVEVAEMFKIQMGYLESVKMGGV